MFQPANTEGNAEDPGKAVVQEDCVGSVIQFFTLSTSACRAATDLETLFQYFV